MSPWGLLETFWLAAVREIWLPLAWPWLLNDLLAWESRTR